VVDEHARELVADRAMDQERGDRGVDAPRERADRAPLTHLLTYAGDLLLGHARGRPGALRLAHAGEEVLEDRGAVGSVDDLRVELDPVQAALDRLEGGDRRARGGGERGEPGRRLVHAVAVAHPARLLAREAGQEASRLPDGELGAPELARLGELNAPAEVVGHGLHPVADPEHRDPELEQLGP
jgi:hypothetical protein